jgi:hypothetical protein
MPCDRHRAPSGRLFFRIVPSAIFDWPSAQRRDLSRAMRNASATHASVDFVGIRLEPGEKRRLTFGGYAENRALAFSSADLFAAVDDASRFKLRQQRVKHAVIGLPGGRNAQPEVSSTHRQGLASPSADRRRPLANWSTHRPPFSILVPLGEIQAAVAGRSASHFT